MSDMAESQRCDVWLFRTRLLKSRALATKFVESGKVRLERSGQVQRLKKASFAVRLGDQLTYMKNQTVFRVEVLGLGERRGPASEAQQLYRLESAERPANPNESRL
jgi:ribosome-associated heat shock protein Hsp15